MLFRDPLDELAYYQSLGMRQQMAFLEGPEAHQTFMKEAFEDVRRRLSRVESSGWFNEREGSEGDQHEERPESPGET